LEVHTGNGTDQVFISGVNASSVFVELGSGSADSLFLDRSNFSEGASFSGGDGPEDIFVQNEFSVDTTNTFGENPAVTKFESVTPEL